MRKLKNAELNRKTIEEFKNSKKIPICIILDNVRSANNIGSVFRTSDAFIVDKIFLCGITATPPNKDIHKTALGSTESVSWEYFENTLHAIEKLKKDKWTIISIEQVENSITLNDFTIEPENKYAIILGNEVKGIDQAVVDACDYCIEIEQLGTKHSLNISVSAGIILWHVFRQLNTPASS